MILCSREYHTLNGPAWFWCTLAKSTPSKQPKGQRYACDSLHHCRFLRVSETQFALLRMCTAALLKTNLVRQRLHRIDSTAMREQPGISVPAAHGKSKPLAKCHTELSD